MLPGIPTKTVKVIVLFMITLIAPSLTIAANQCATYAITENKLNVPCLNIASASFHADFKLVGLNLELTDIKVNSKPTDPLQCASYDVTANKLNVPCMGLGNQNFWLVLQLSSANPVILSLVDFGAVKEQGDGSTGVKGLRTELKALDPYGNSNGTIDWNNNYTFFQQADGDNGPYIAGGPWSEKANSDTNGGMLTIHYTWYQYPESDLVKYDGYTMKGSVKNAQGVLMLEGDKNTTNAISNPQPID